MHAQLPIFTRLIIHFSYGLQHYGLFILAAFISAGGIFYHIKYRPALKKMTDQFLLKFPIAGTAVEKFILIHLTRNLSTLFAAGIPLTDALNNLIHSMGNIIYRNALQNIAKDLSVGKQLHFALQNCRLFPAMMVQMIQIGEESGALEKMLVKIAEFYESDLDYLIGHLSRLLEPLIMIILGVVIGGLVIAMYLPIFKLGTVI